MKFHKFSETTHRIDQNGTVTILIDKHTMLKISSAEISIMFEQTLQRLSGEEKAKLCEALLASTLTQIQVPDSVQDTIRASFIGEDIEPEIEKKVLTEEAPQPKVEMSLTDEEKDILLLVDLLVNEGSPSNEIGFDEFKGLTSAPPERITTLLLDAGYDVKTKPNSLIITLGGKNEPLS